MLNVLDRFNRSPKVCDLPVDGSLDCSGVALRQAMPALATAAALGLMLVITQPAEASDILRSGMFTGQSDHVTTGTVRIEKDGESTVLVLASDFSLDGAPSPTLGFSVGGKFVEASEFAELRSLEGEQRYVLPKGFETTGYDAVTVWCDRFSVPLGSAPLS